MTINSIIQYIEDNLELHFIYIDDLVSYSGYSRRYLQLLFKNYVKFPIGKYIQMRRVSRAAFLLRLTNQSIIDISEKLLYDSQQTFTREFKKITGYTPKRYRNLPYWSFNNIIGCRKIDETPPKPMICNLKEKEVWGCTFEHRELPYIRENSKTRNYKINQNLKKQKKITLSNKFSLDKTSDKALVSTIMWTNKNDANCKIIINGGTYACFSFYGTLDEYNDYIKNIYEKSLQIYNIDVKDAYDIEVISIASNNKFNFNYYLPVYEENNVSTKK